MTRSQAQQEAERREREEMFSVHPDILAGTAQPRRTHRAKRNLGAVADASARREEEQQTAGTRLNRWSRRPPC